MSVEGQHIDIQDAFTQQAMEITPAAPEIQQVATPVLTNQDVDQTSYMVRTAEVAANDSCFSGIFGATCNLTSELCGAKHQVTVSINGGQEMDANAVKNDFTPSLSPNSSFSS